MANHMSSLEEQFCILVVEGGTLTPIFKIYKLIKGIENMDYDNLKIEMRTHSEWYYVGCV